AYTMRINEVPASSGYGEPISKFFRLHEGAKVVSALTTDPRFTPADEAPDDGEPPGPHLFVVSAQGQTLRLSVSSFRSASKVNGRQVIKLSEGDKVAMVQLVRDEKTAMLASGKGHVLHFPIEEVPVLAGVGKGVIGIKLKEGDTCLGGTLLRN